MDIKIEWLLCVIASVGTGLAAYNLCKYFHVDEKETVERLISVKNHERKAEAQKLNAFTDTKSEYQFKIFSKLLENIKFTEHLKNMLERADISLQVDTFIILSALLGIVPLFIAIFTFPAIAIFCLVGIFGPYGFLIYKIKKRTTLFTQQLPDALDLLCNALRAGHSLFSAFGIIVNEMPNPINGVFKILTDEIALGVDVKDAMKSLQEMVPDSVDLRFFTTVVILQREIGGNLIRLLEILAKTIRERFKMIGQLKAQTMQAKLSGLIVSVIPPIVVVVLCVMAPDYVHYLTDHLWGKIALVVSVILMIIGIFIIHKITDIDI